MKKLFIIITLFILSVVMISCSESTYTVTYIDSLTEEVLTSDEFSKEYSLGNDHNFDFVHRGEGYYFAGVFTLDGVEVSDESPFTITKDTTLTVLYEANEFIATLYTVDETETVLDIFVSNTSIYVLTSNYRVLVFGDNYAGHLGMSLAESTSIPEDITKQIPLSDGEFVTNITINDRSVLFETNTDQIYLLHKNYTSYHGYNKTINITSDLGLNSDETVTSIVSGVSQIYLKTSNKRLLFFSVDYSGVHSENVLDSFALNQGDYIEDIYPGTTVFAVSKDGLVFGWGTNTYGQVGNDTISEIQNEGSSAMPIDTRVQEPVNITDYFGFNQDERIIDITKSYSHILFLTNQNRLFATGYLQIANVFNTSDDLEKQISKIPYDITDVIPLYSSEKIESMINLENFVLLFTSEDRVISTEKIGDIYMEPIDPLLPFYDVTDLVPDNILSYGRNLGIYYFLDEAHQVQVLGTTFSDNLPLIDNMDLDLEGFNAFCSYRNPDDMPCYGINTLLDVTDYLSIGYQIDSYYIFRYNQEYTITDRYNDIFTGLAIKDFDMYPASNLYLVIDE